MERSQAQYLAQHSTITLHNWITPQLNTDHHIMHSVHETWHIPTSPRFFAICTKIHHRFQRLTARRSGSRNMPDLPRGFDYKSHVSCVGARTAMSETGEELTPRRCVTRLHSAASTASAEVHYSYDHGRIGRTRWHLHSNHNASWGAHDSCTTADVKV